MRLYSSMILTRMPSHLRHAILTSSIVVALTMVLGQRVPEQVGDGHLRLAVLDALLHLAQACSRRACPAAWR
jgi:hypothetical protein